LWAFFEGSNDAVAVRDVERRFLVWNTRFAEATRKNCGVDVEAGMRVEDYLKPESLSPSSSQRDRLPSG
jgi:PAS domain-containing protein